MEQQKSGLENLTVDLELEMPQPEQTESTADGFDWLVRAGTSHSA
jgi:hypothetical protein